MADLQRRLRAAGFGCDDPSGTFGPSTDAAVRAFQQSNGLHGDGMVDAATWAAVVESEYALGGRLLCLRSPMMRGDDVSELQLRLGALGFDAGRVDGIFGPLTLTAVGDFQRNAGLITDEVCGPDTVEALMRLEGRGGSATVTAVRERDRLRRGLRSLHHMKVAVGSARPLDPVTLALASALRLGGVDVILVDGGWSEQAAAANDFDSDVYLGVVVVDRPAVEASYFEVPGFASAGGRRLAELVVKELPASPGWGIGSVTGMRLPILRETRSSAVLLELGDEAAVDAHQALVVTSLQRALEAWADDPCDDDSTSTSA